MSEDVATNAASIVENGETENCQPCILQDKKTPSEYWCPDCAELLCKSCYGHHRVLKATKSHVPYSVNEYLVVRDIVSKIDLKCKIHSDRQLDFFCKFHESFCCGVCKSEHQLPSCDIQDINHYYANQEKEQVFQNDEVAINDLHIKMKNLLVNQLENKKTLDQYRQTFYEELKRSRQEIEKYLDKFEETIKAQFEEQFDISQTAIIRNITEIEGKSEEVMKRQSIIKKLKQCHKIPTVADFHTRVLIRRENKEDEAILKDISPVEFICYAVVSLVDEKSQLITLNNKSQKYTFCHDDSKIAICEHDDYENSSSTVEAEAVSLSENSTKCGKLSSSDMEHQSSSQDETSSLSDKLTIADKTSKQNEDDKTVMACEHAQYTNCNSTVEAKAVFLNKDTAKSDASSFSHSEHLTRLQNKASTWSHTFTRHRECFEQIHGFDFHQYERNIRVECVRIMFNGIILMTETSEDRLLAYYENGDKAGELEFDETPGNIAIISENKVAVTVKIIVFLVVTDNLAIVKAINMHDVCFGVAFVNNQLVVNCCQKGITVVLPSGKLIRAVPDIKGYLHLCALDDDTIMSVKNSRYDNQLTVFRFNIDDDFTETYSHPDLVRVDGIVHDGQNSVFISSEDNKILKLNYQTGVWKEILNEEDELDSPYSIDFDQQNDTLIVANNEGRSLSFYKRYFNDTYKY